MSKLYLYGGVAVALLLAIVVNVYTDHRHAEARYAAGVQDGRNAVLAEDARAAEKLAQQRDQLNAYSALATTGMSAFLGEKLPANEAASHASEDTIRIIYRDRPVPADLCSRPDGVQAELDKAVDAANAAATDHVQL